MPRAEVGSTKHLSNKLKSKGLQRLRWYCQVCERQMRDENGFKCHTQSESHVRQMLLVGEDPRKHIESYSNEFLKDFIKLLKTSHGEKQIHINHFYQEYIANKEHIHMNATKWPSLSEFAKFLGREGICRVEETEKGLFISWIDNSPEALRRQAAVRAKERQDRGDEEREQKLIEEQVRRARMDKEASGRNENGNDDEAHRTLQRAEGERIKLNFGATKTPTDKQRASPSSEAQTAENGAYESDNKPTTTQTTSSESNTHASQEEKKTSIKMDLSGGSKPKNVFAAASKKNGSVKKKVDTGPKPMSAMERIIKEETERKRPREKNGSGPINFKRQKV